jgi:hypothetical protein
VDERTTEVSSFRFAARRSQALTTSAWLRRAAKRRQIRAPLVNLPAVYWWTLGGPP